MALHTTGLMQLSNSSVLAPGQHSSSSAAPSQPAFRGNHTARHLCEVMAGHSDGGGDPRELARLEAE